MFTIRRIWEYFGQVRKLVDPFRQRTRMLSERLIPPMWREEREMTRDGDVALRERRGERERKRERDAEKYKAGGRTQDDH